MNYGSLIIYITLALLFFIIILNIIWNINNKTWGNFQISQLQNFITNNSIVLNDFDALPRNKYDCFFKNLTKKVSYKQFQKILDIQLKSKDASDYEQFLNNNNDYQEFILNILKYISICLKIEIDADAVKDHLGSKLIGNPEKIANQLNTKYTLNEFSYLDKFYTEPTDNISESKVITDFLNFMDKINK